MTASLEIAFERVTGNTGAIVRGVGLDETRESVSETLCWALHEYGVLFFEFGHFLSGEEFSQLGRLFGEPKEQYGLSLTGMADKPTHFDAELTPLKEYRIAYWHSDGTPMEHPPRAAMLTPVELPEAGGDTMWANMCAAWEDLSSYYQNLLEGLDALHTTSRLPFLEQAPTAVHPAVITDRVTGRKMLYVNSNYTERFLGMKDAESDALLRMLFEHINTPEFHVRRRWQPGVVAVWEQRVTQHRGVADFTGPRKLRRIHFEGDRPTR